MHAISKLGVLVASGSSGAALMCAQTAQAPQEPLVDSIVTVLHGSIRPGRTVLISDRAVDFPDGCAFHYILPPGKAALQWNQLTPPTIDKENNTCQATFEVGVPASVAKAMSNGTIPEAAFQKSLPSGALSLGGRKLIPHDAPTQNAGYFKMWWTDPLGLTPTWAQANLTWNWELLLCVSYVSGFLL
jgi:hypothetical protein